jgi:hypothetical protein
MAASWRTKPCVAGRALKVLFTAGYTRNAIELGTRIRAILDRD